MIHYLGLPMWPQAAAPKILAGRHAFVSFARMEQVGIAIEVCQSWALDNGAFSAWKAGKATDWQGFYEYCTDAKRIPNCDFAIIPDMIDGNEKDNDALINEWPHGVFGVPVWHMHESIERLFRLASEWPRIAIGSSGEFATVGDRKWWDRIAKAMNAICDESGMPMTKIHGLRMLDPDVFSRLPFASADSTSVARNIGIDSKWRGTYSPSSKEVRGIVLAERIESHQAAAHWNRAIVPMTQQSLF